MVELWGFFMIVLQHEVVDPGGAGFSQSWGQGVTQLSPDCHLRLSRYQRVARHSIRGRLGHPDTTQQITREQAAGKVAVLRSPFTGIVIARGLPGTRWADAAIVTVAPDAAQRFFAHSDHDPSRPAGVDHDSLRTFNAIARRMGLVRRDSILNGADDDGSGTVALVEIAEAMASAATKPRRSVLFVWHAAEELGLLGAEYFTDNPACMRAPAYPSPSSLPAAAATTTRSPTSRSTSITPSCAPWPRWSTVSPAASATCRTG
jgi:hypothetical protein